MQRFCQSLAGSRAIVAIFCGLCLGAATVGEPAHGENSSMTPALFGLPLNQPPLQGMSPDEVADYVVAGGVRAVVHVPHNPEIIAALRARGVRCYGETGCFVGDGHWKSHPESRPVLADGSLLEKAGWYAGVCANQDWLADAIVDRVRRQGEELEIDGVWLDFIRWPTRWEMREPMLFESCYCDKCLADFQKAREVAIPDDRATVPEKAAWIRENAREAWVDWRTELIVEVVRRVRDAIRETRGEGAIVGIFTVPLLREEHDNAIVRIVGQDAEKLAEVVDVFSPMSYHAMCERDLEWITALNAELAHLTDREIWPIIQARPEPREIGPKEYRQVLEAGLKGGASGIMPFTADDVLGTPLWDVQAEVYRDAVSSASSSSLSSSASSATSATE